MSIYTVSELLAPLLVCGVLLFGFSGLIGKTKNRSFYLRITASAVLLVSMITVWILVLRYSNHLQCVAAYGDLASDSKMCDNPASGMGALFVQLPVLLVAWMISTLILLFNRDLRKPDDLGRSVALGKNLLVTVTSITFAASIFFGSRSASASGGLTKEQVNETITRNLNSVTSCYDEGLKTNPKLEGVVRTQIEISAAGTVSNVEIEKSELQNSEVEKCIIEEIRKWVFIKPLGGVAVKTSYPFRFRKLKANP